MPFHECQGYRLRRCHRWRCESEDQSTSLRHLECRPRSAGDPSARTRNDWMPVTSIPWHSSNIKQLSSLMVSTISEEWRQAILRSPNLLVEPACETFFSKEMCDISLHFTLFICFLSDWLKSPTWTLCCNCKEMAEQSEHLYNTVFSRCNYYWLIFPSSISVPLSIAAHAVRRNIQSPRLLLLLLLLCL